MESKRHQAKEGKLRTAYTADFNMRGGFFTERFDFLNEPRLLQLREAFRKKNPTNLKTNPNPTLPCVYQSAGGNASFTHPAARLTGP